MSTEVENVNTTNEDNNKSELMSILICSSNQNCKYAQDLKAALEWANVDIWQDVFIDTSISSVYAFCDKLSSYDLSIILLPNDDVKFMNEGGLPFSQNEIFQNITASFAYLGRTNTLVVIEVKEVQDIIPMGAIQVTSFFYHDFSKPTDEIAARIEWHCNENKERWDTKKQSDMRATTAKKEQSLRAELARTRNLLNYAKFNEFTEPKPDVSGELILRYEFPTKYGDGTNHEFLLIKREEDIILTDQGKTWAVLDKTFELREPDVQKNLLAILKQYKVNTVKDSHEFLLTLSTWTDNPNDEENTELKEAVFRLYACITFMDSMKVFYV